MYSHFKRIWAGKNLSIWVKVVSAGAGISGDLDSSVRVHECTSERGERPRERCILFLNGSLTN